MNLIKILVSSHNGRVFDTTELDYVKKTLSIKRENNAFSPDFEVSHTTHPFLIIENDKSITALGPRDLTTVFKVKTVTVTVVEMDQHYVGELQIRQYTNGFRKANLRYASNLLTLTPILLLMWKKQLICLLHLVIGRIM